jgi:hypothetical protein
MKQKFKIILIFLLFFSACQTNSTFDQPDINSIDLTKITGESPYPQSFFDSALWSAILAAALLTALSSTESTYNSTNMSGADLDSEWIE